MNGTRNKTTTTRRFLSFLTTGNVLLQLTTQILLTFSFFLSHAFSIFFFFKLYLLSEASNLLLWLLSLLLLWNWTRHSLTMPFFFFILIKQDQQKLNPSCPGQEQYNSGVLWEHFNWRQWHEQKSTIFFFVFCFLKKINLLFFLNLF